MSRKIKKVLSVKKGKIRSEVMAVSTRTGAACFISMTEPSKLDEKATSGSNATWNGIKP